MIIGSRLRAVKLGHLVAHVTVETSPLLCLIFLIFTLHPMVFLLLQQSNTTHYRPPPPTPDKINYIPLQWYHQALLLVIENMSNCRVFIITEHRESPGLNGAAYLSTCACGIPLSYSIELWLSCSEKERKKKEKERQIVTFPAFSLCAWCYTQWWSIIEWFCEGINEIRDCVYSSVALD